MMALQSPNAKTVARFGGQPIALAAVALVLLLVGAGSAALWRATSGTSPETDRVASVRQIQARAAQASEQLVEKTKALDLSQQEAIDQLQALQDQMLIVKRLLAAQQSDTKRLSDQLSELTAAIEGLRQSFASAQAADTPSEPSARHSTARVKSHAQRSNPRKHSRSRT
jgi:chromosome segregation ATPase